VDGNWTETLLHTFLRNHQDGGYPNGVIIDSAGNLYGTTQIGGAHLGGTVFQLTLANGSWTENVLYNFCSAANCTDGQIPPSALVLDSAGNLYGTTQAGGLINSACGGVGCGVVFQLSPGVNNTWTERTIHAFCPASNCINGASPSTGALIVDANGNLFGTTISGGFRGTNCNTEGCGTVYELTPGSGGAWSESALFRFPSDGKHGLGPSGLVLDPAGNLYGTTGAGGAFNNGTVFEIIP
jgi:uncharacterized repeat protein (TIGR03803 family)